jgi:hypothetical protein
MKKSFGDVRKLLPPGRERVFQAYLKAIVFAIQLQQKEDESYDPSTFLDLLMMKGLDENVRAQTHTVCVCFTLFLSYKYFCSLGII